MGTGEDNAGTKKRMETPNSNTTATVAPERNPINLVLVEFLSAIQSIQKTHSIVLPHVLLWLKNQHEASAKKLAKYASQNENEIDVYRAQSAHQASEMLKVIRALDGLGGMRIPDTLRRSLFTQLFSEYDAFVGALLKAIYKKKPELLKSISREISFGDLLDYESLDAIKQELLDKEVEAFRRTSYVDQFASLEAKFVLTLRNFPEWGEFVELSQRRNLIVHNGGVVSDQYLIICDRVTYKFQERPKLGDTLELDSQYFARATTVVSKVAFMLCHTLWRKVFPLEKEVSHTDANSVLYDLIRDKRWGTANEIAKFSLTAPMKKDISDMELRLRTINTAIAEKFSGDEDGCKATLKSLDWSAALRDFSLAISVLSDEFSTAATLMRSIGKRGELVEELSYHDWPLFHKFRETPEFLEAYAEVYGVSFLTESIRHKTEAVQNSQAEFEKRTEHIYISADFGQATELEKTAIAKNTNIRKRISSKQLGVAGRTIDAKKLT